MNWIGYGITSDGVHVTMIGDLPRTKALTILEEWNDNETGKVFRLIDLYSGKRGEGVDDR